MSVERSTRDPDTAPIPKVRAANERRRAAVVLVGLAVAAVVLVVIMLAVLGDSGNSSGPTSVGQATGPAVVVPSSATSARTSPTTASSSSAVTSSASSRPSTRQVSCPSAAPCALPDDIGNVVGALNAYRATKQLAPVTGKVTQSAATCAVSSANTCPSGFFWEPVGRSGTQVIDKIVSSGRGAGRLLAPGLKSVEVGWAYVPSSKSFECALVVGG